MADPHRLVPKPLAFRCVELLRALQLINDSIKHIHAGEIRHLATLSGQLRALLTDSTQYRQDRKPLLLDLADVFQQDLRVFCMPGLDEADAPERSGPKPVFEMAGFPITLHRELTTQVETTFPELLDKEIIDDRGSRCTVTQLINWYANKAGGAHYDPTLPEGFARLFTLNPAKTAVPNYLRQIGDATLAIGRRMLTGVVDLEMHFVLAVPPQKADCIAPVNFLYDSWYEGSTMRLSLVLNNQLVPWLVVTGFQEMRARIASDRLIDWSEPRHLYASVTLEPDLSTQLTLVVDGTLVGCKRVKEPLFIVADPINYTTCYKRKVDGEPQQFSFALGGAKMYSGELGPVDHANVFLEMNGYRGDKDLPMALFKPKSYGRSKPGTKDLSFFDGAIKTTARNLFGGSDSTEPGRGAASEEGRS